VLGQTPLAPTEAEFYRGENFGARHCIQKNSGLTRVHPGTPAAAGREQSVWARHSEARQQCVWRRGWLADAARTDVTLLYGAVRGLGACEEVAVKRVLRLKP